ncbi:DUF4401 domain-containing protein [Flavihumibacter cheonanensis]|uniref:DUF4401 domain-containing protein n=1 Tax=Flavihumibacter cheonanensis TaxID=1442385 RepID=UPI001EF81359|nr:DUF4401 domain-containing protein [Flavihumibacter cheonanensis]MCG7753144.1 DUF4401 domain-containing protein [Flavihumibacter cheonanensis]
MSNMETKPPVQVSLPIKIISIIGGVLAGFSFVGFLFLVGLFESPVAQLAGGLLFIAMAIWLDKQYNNVLLDTMSISLFLIGGFLTGLGLSEFGASNTVICLVYILIGAICFFITQNLVLALVALLSIHASIVSIILTNDLHEMILAYIPILAAGCYYIYSNQDEFKKYPAIRTAITVAFLSALILPGIRYTIPISPAHVWIASAGIILIVLYLVHSISKQYFEPTSGWSLKLQLAVLLFLLPTLFAPSIAGSIFLLLLAFQFGYKTGFVLAIISGIYFISQYYYDLSFTLLTKSMLLLLSGSVFLVLYFILSKKLRLDEKI